MLKNWFALGNKPKTFEFRCTCCGELHKGSPSFSYSAPAFYNSVPKNERGQRTFLTEDTCVIDDEFFFIRGLLEVSIHGVKEPFLWGVWVSQSEESFMRYQNTFGKDQTGDGSFGWLAVVMQAYDRTPMDQNLESLACNIEWQGKGQRPKVYIRECDHPLYRDFCEGISWDRAVEIAQQTMHPE